MIKIIRGTYGHKVGNRVVPKTNKSEPFELTAAQEERLVKMGIAAYVNVATPPVDDANVEDGTPIGFDELPELPEGVTGIPEYSANMTAKELRAIGELCGLSFGERMSKAKMIEALDAFFDANMADGVDEDDIIPDEEDAPTFDPASAVVE